MSRRGVRVGLVPLRSCSRATSPQRGRTSRRFVHCAGIQCDSRQGLRVCEEFGRRYIDPRQRETPPLHIDRWFGARAAMSTNAAQSIGGSAFMRQAVLLMADEANRRHGGSHEPPDGVFDQNVRMRQEQNVQISPPQSESSGTHPTISIVRLEIREANRYSTHSGFSRM
jgi:hypothetical protein